MTESPQPSSPLPIPRWLRFAASVLIAGHLIAVLSLVLAANSGPWPVDDGYGFASSPHFAQGIYAKLSGYMNALKLTNNYHFTENDVANVHQNGFAAEFDVRLRDKEGKEITTLRFPDRSALPIVRHRQSILAAGLNSDEIVEPRPGEFVPAPDQPIRSVRVWENTDNRTGKLGTMQEHLIPRDRPVAGPSDLAMILSRSYARYLCRENNAASAEIVRYTRQVIPPDVLYTPENFPAEVFQETTMSFGVFDALTK